MRLAIFDIKKESPNEGTETLFVKRSIINTKHSIKKESPNEGTETTCCIVYEIIDIINKKRIPE